MVVGRPLGRPTLDWCNPNPGCATFSPAKAHPFPMSAVSPRSRVIPGNPDHGERDLDGTARPGSRPGYRFRNTCSPDRAPWPDDLDISAKGDLHIDAHTRSRHRHCPWSALPNAGDKQGIRRYGMPTCHSTRPCRAWLSISPVAAGLEYRWSIRVPGSASLTSIWSTNSFRGLSPCAGHRACGWHFRTECTPHRRDRCSRLSDARCAWRLSRMHAWPASCRRPRAACNRLIP